MSGSLSYRAQEVAHAGLQGRLHPIRHNRRLYRKCCGIGNAFACFKQGRAIAMRHTRCSNLLLSAIALAAAVNVWLPKQVS